jgi:hypothetical protein
MYSKNVATQDSHIENAGRDDERSPGSLPSRRAAAAGICSPAGQHSTGAPDARRHRGVLLLAVHGQSAGLNFLCTFWYRALRHQHEARQNINGGPTNTTDVLRPEGGKRNWMRASQKRPAPQLRISDLGSSSGERQASRLHPWVKTGTLVPVPQSELLLMLQS